MSELILPSAPLSSASSPGAWASTTTSTTGCSRTASSSSAPRSRDENANAICAQLLLLAAEDPDKDIWLYINSPGRLRDRRHGDLRHHAVHPARRRHRRDGPGRLDGAVPAVAGRQGQALRPAARPDPDAPAAPAASAARRPTSRSRPSRCCTSRSRWPSSSPQHTGQTVEQITKDADRDRWFTAARGAGVRPRRPRRRERRPGARRRRDGVDARPHPTRPRHNEPP